MPSLSLLWYNVVGGEAMYNIEILKNSIIKHMKLIGLVNDRKGVSKANIVLSVARKMNMDEYQENLIEEAFDDLVREDKIRSSYNKYDEDGKLINIAISVQEERFYLNK